MEGNLPFLPCFTLYLRAISSTSPPGGLHLEGRFNRGSVLRYEFGGLIFGGAYTNLQNFTVMGNKTLRQLALQRRGCGIKYECRGIVRNYIFQDTLP